MWRICRRSLGVAILILSTKFEGDLLLPIKLPAQHDIASATARILPVQLQ